MIICLNVSQRTKDQLDELLESGGYRDYSEAMAVAVANQLVLHGHGAERLATVGDAEFVATNHCATEERNGNATATQSLETPQVPALFSYLGSGTNVERAASYPDETLIVSQEVPVDRWIFGQHNKLLPVKATCRALARMMTTEVNGNVALAKTASDIASEAVRLGDYLRKLDDLSGVHRDDALSFAFPYSDSPNGDKSRLRYANQFVASVTKQGTLTGLPIELKLVNRDNNRIPRILLTEAGWRFAEMRNPILDDAKDGRQSKFSDEEIEFLLAHIRSRVPVEAFAYRVVHEAIAQGANTPDKLDNALEDYVPKRVAKPFTRAFLTTQRAGVVSRMVDLGLVQRIRDGIKVTYTAAGRTFESSPNPLRQVV
jgi:hypothetical protein